MPDKTFLDSVGRYFDAAAVHTRSARRPPQADQDLQLRLSDLLPREDRRRGEGHRGLPRPAQSPPAAPPREVSATLTTLTRRRSWPLATLMSYKCAHRRRTLRRGPRAACASIPWEYSEADLEKITRRYTTELIRRKFIGPGHRRARPPTTGTGPREMAWIYDTLPQLPPRRHQRGGAA